MNKFNLVEESQYILYLSKSVTIFYLIKQKKKIALIPRQEILIQFLIRAQE